MNTSPIDENTDLRTLGWCRMTRAESKAARVAQRVSRPKLMEELRPAEILVEVERWRQSPDLDVKARLATMPRLPKFVEHQDAMKATRQVKLSAKALARRARKVREREELDALIRGYRVPDDRMPETMPVTHREATDAEVAKWTRFEAERRVEAA